MAKKKTAAPLRRLEPLRSTAVGNAADALPPSEPFGVITNEMLLDALKEVIQSNLRIETEIKTLKFNIQQTAMLRGR